MSLSAVTGPERAISSLSIRFVLSDAYTQMGREERQALLHVRNPIKPSSAAT